MSYDSAFLTRYKVKKTFNWNFNFLNLISESHKLWDHAENKSDGRSTLETAEAITSLVNSIYLYRTWHTV